MNKLSKIAILFLASTEKVLADNAIEDYNLVLTFRSVDGNIR